MSGRRTGLVVEVLPDAQAIGRRAAEEIAAELEEGRLRVLGVATGSSPSPVYTQLAVLAECAATTGRGANSWEGVQLFALDEYVGLAAGHPQGYRAVVEREVARPLGVPAAQVHVPDGSAATDAGLARAAAAYEAALAAAGGFDLQLLGIGANGHIGFNEPGSSLTSRTRVVELTGRTRADNARFFATPEDVPHRALTQGIATIAAARRHVLVAQGERKAAAVLAMLHGPLDAACPASAVRGFADVLVLLDPAAAGLLG